MKQNLFYLIALICSMTFFTACGDDDDTTWQQIPQTEITGENAVLVINGMESETGSVQMTVNDGATGRLTLKDVVPGYNTVPVDVTLEKQPNNSFNFKGTARMNTMPAPVRAAQQTPAVVTIDVTGNITLEGKISVQVEMSGVGSLIGLYEGEKLSLKYSGAELLGKTAALSVLDGENMALMLVGVIPGEMQVVISGVQPDAAGHFKGEGTTIGGAKVKYTGDVVAGQNLSLELEVTLSDDAQGGMARTWELSKEVYNELEVGRTAVAITWNAIDQEAKNCEYLATLGSVLGAHLISEVLDNVTFGADGNITASYFTTLLTGEVGVQDWIMGKIFDNSSNVTPADRTWLKSPKNLAFWYAKGGKLYIVPNLEMILKQVSQDGAGDFAFIAEMIKGMAAADDPTLTGLLNTLKEMDVVKNLGIDLSSLTLTKVREIMGWLVTGIPLNYAITPEGLEISVDKAMVAPFMAILLPALPQVDKLIEEMAATDPTIGVLPMILGFEKISDIQEVWKSNTADFKLGLVFSGKQLAR